MNELDRSAAELDAQHPGRRDEFIVPPDHSPSPFDEVAYFAGNSLGLQPRVAAPAVEQELADWANLAVEGHFEAKHQWHTYHEHMRADLAHIVGAKPSEVVAMNTLTVNLHMLMAAFYRPTPQRYKILIEDKVFSSDSYAVRSQAKWHGLDPDDTVIRLKPRPGEDCLRTEDIINVINTNDIALSICSAVGYLTGELLDLPEITKAAKNSGAVVGWDLAHAAGNVPLDLHGIDADFAAWCNYKYLNSGPGAIAGAFIHERHHTRTDLTRLEGWWSTKVETRFEMSPVADPPADADAWAVSNPPILAFAPVRVSAAMFAESGMPALRARSELLTGFLDDALRDVGAEIVTPHDPAKRGAQLSVRVNDASATVKRLRAEHGVIADARKPDIIRLAPTPMYSTFADCARAVTAIAQEVP